MPYHYPKGVWVLSFSEMWDTFSYLAAQTILVLYFTQIFHLSKAESYTIYGAYAAFAFALPILGGIAADRWLGSKHAVFIGSILNGLGNLLLMSFERHWFSIGLAVSLIGAGLCKSNATHLIGTLEYDSNSKKESAFTCIYLAVNVGGTLGPFIFGAIAYTFGWNYGFLCSAIGLFIGAFWLRWNWCSFPDEKHRDNYRRIILYSSLVMLGLCAAISILFYWTYLINPLVVSVFIMSLLYLLSAIIKYQGEERRRLLALFTLYCFSLFYFAVGLQIGTTITSFIQDKIQQGLIPIKWPASTFNTLYPLFVVLLAPFFSYLWKSLRAKQIELQAPARLAIGIALAIFGMLSFAFAAASSYILTGIILGYLFLSAGELALTPAIYTAISNLSPTGIKSTMMGGWFLFVALGGYVSGTIANLSQDVTSHLQFANQYVGGFLMIAVFTAVILLGLLLATPKLNKIINQ